MPFPSVKVAYSKKFEGDKSYKGDNETHRLCGWDMQTKMVLNLHVHVHVDTHMKKIIQ